MFTFTLASLCVAQHTTTTATASRPPTPPSTEPAQHGACAPPGHAAVGSRSLDNSNRRNHATLHPPWCLKPSTCARSQPGPKITCPEPQLPPSL